MKTNAQKLAVDLALDVLKAYHAKIKSVHMADSSAVEREQAQAAAFEAAEKGIRRIVDTPELCCDNYGFLDEPSKEEQDR